MDMDVHGHDAWMISPCCSFEFTGKYPVCFDYFSVKFMCLVIEDPDVTNVRAGFVLFSPKVPECRAITGRGGVAWNAVLPPEFLPCEPPALWDSLQRTRPEFLLNMRRVFSC